MMKPFTPRPCLLLPAPAAPALAQSEICFLFPSGVEELTCTCGPGPHDFPVMGSGPYTEDSSICAAAVHAGVVGPEGGEVTVISAPAPDPKDWRGTTANGVRSEHVMYPHRAYSFVGAEVAEPLPLCGSLEDTALNCHCEPLQPFEEVWGSGPYTGNSDICTAARHAGMIDTHGGEITLQRAPGQESYVGSMAAGVRTSDHGPSDASFIIVQSE